MDPITRPPVRHRRVSARVRRRRTLAVVIAVAVTVAIVALTTSSSSNHHAATRSTVVRHAHLARPVARISAVDEPWVLQAPVSRATVVTDGSSLSIIGGVEANQSSSNGVFRLDPATGLLTQTGTLALPTHDAAGAMIGGHAFLFGGGSQTVVDAVQAMETPGPATTAGHLPQPRADFASARVGGTIYLVGGYDGSTATRDVLATTNGRTFTVEARLPIGVRYPAAAATENGIYVFGGEWAGTQSSAVQAIDLHTHSARVVGHLPE